MGEMVAVSGRPTEGLALDMGNAPKRARETPVFVLYPGWWGPTSKSKKTADRFARRRATGRWVPGPLPREGFCQGCRRSQPTMMKGPQLSRCPPSRNIPRRGALPEAKAKEGGGACGRILHGRGLQILATVRVA